MGSVGPGSNLVRSVVKKKKKKEKSKETIQMVKKNQARIDPPTLSPAVNAMADVTHLHMIVKVVGISVEHIQFSHGELLFPTTKMVFFPEWSAERGTVVNCLCIERPITTRL